MTSKVKRRATRPSLFDLPGHGFLTHPAQIPRKNRSESERFLTFLKPHWREDMFDAQTLADRYVAAWNERDAARRRNAIAALWAPGGQRHRDARAQRHDAVARPSLGSPEAPAGPHGRRFRAARNARRLNDVVTFRWEMLPPDSDAVLSSGIEFLVIDDEGRILIDHPFVPA
jgi:hypothetical protein